MNKIIFFIVCIMTDRSNSSWHPNVLLKYAAVVGNSLIKNPRIVFPGTEWCGGSHITQNDEDLGPFYETNICCRERALCPDIIKSLQSNHDFTNYGLYTRLNCDCDDKFRKCLHRANTPTSNIIGLAYFNVLKPQCFKYTDHAECVKRGLDLRCTEYSYDISKGPRYQWFDEPSYKV